MLKVRRETWVYGELERTHKTYLPFNCNNTTQDKKRHATHLLMTAKVCRHAGA